MAAWCLPSNKMHIIVPRYRFVVTFLGQCMCRFSFIFFILVSIESRKDGKDQETIQSSTTPDTIYHMGK